MRDETLGRETRPPWKEVLLGAASFLATPVVITGMFRLTSDAIPGWMPLVVLSIVAIGLWFVERVPRSVSIGILAGCVAWTAFLYWLFARWDSMSGG